MTATISATDVTAETTTYVQVLRAGAWMTVGEFRGDTASARALRDDLGDHDLEVRTCSDAPNAYGGRDYRTPRGMIRTCRDDGERTLHAFIGSGTCTWSASFNGSPVEMYAAFDAAVYGALRSIDWQS